MKNNTDSHIVFPEVIRRLGIWPINIALFFLYNNVVTIMVVIVTSVLLGINKVTDEEVIAGKIEGASLIATILTLGLTILYRRTFYVTREPAHTDAVPTATPDHAGETKSEDQSQPDQKI